jgi:hypothetical protein
MKKKIKENLENIESLFNNKILIEVIKKNIVEIIVGEKF